MSNAGLPEDGEAVVAGVRLPPGRRVAGAREGLLQRRPWQPGLWATGHLDDAVTTWLALRDALRGHQESLVPLLLSDLSSQYTEPGRPWETAELRRPVPGPYAGLDPAALLAALWEDVIPDEEEDDEYTAEALDPFTRVFPGLAQPSAVAASGAALAQAASEFGSPLRIGLVAADRPADALTAIGWTGSVNAHESPETLGAVLQTWEDRFGAVLAHVGFDSVDLLVERPPQTEADALAVAAEHFAFCGDNVYQGAGSVREYAAGLPGAVRWSFWWD